MRIQFIIQADFLLPANREDILSYAWNLHLRLGLNVAFRQAVDKMNKILSLQYIWFRYLPAHVQISFLSPLLQAIKQTLLQSRVIWSWVKILETPKTLLYIPPQFLDRHGNPLMANSSAFKTYLSPKYDWNADQTSLKSLGIEVLSTSSFIRAIKSLSQLRTKDWGDKSREWHGDVAAALNSSPSLFRSPKVSHLPIVPLRDGTWTSTSSPGTTIFLDPEDGLHIPTGIDIRLVDGGAARNSARVAMYRNLGITTCNNREVSELILGKDRDGYRNFAGASETRAHLVYLFNARAQPPSLPYTHLWVASNRNKYAKAKDLYIDIPGKDSLIAWFKSDSDCLDFIRSNYLSMISGDKHASWLQWLVNTIGIARSIRLTE